MSASPGRGLLLRVNTSGSIFTTAGGLRTKQVKRSSAKVDVTSADSAGRWQELLPGAAAQGLSFAAARLRLAQRRRLCGGQERLRGRHAAASARSSIPAPASTRAPSW